MLFARNVLVQIRDVRLQALLVQCRRFLLCLHVIDRDVARLDLALQRDDHVLQGLDFILEIILYVPLSLQVLRVLLADGSKRRLVLSLDGILLLRRRLLKVRVGCVASGETLVHHPVLLLLQQFAGIQQFHRRPSGLVLRHDRIPIRHDQQIDDLRSRTEFDGDMQRQLIELGHLLCHFGICRKECRDQPRRCLSSACLMDRQTTPTVEIQCGILGSGELDPNRNLAGMQFGYIQSIAPSAIFDRQKQRGGTGGVQHFRVRFALLLAGFLAQRRQWLGLFGVVVAIVVVVIVVLDIS
mmetsp:Transcript_21977/g.62603  ORF Transcript_21977/g.62603 Transcript_21977/m.62603 type:complete len:297 (-) Transcript_21977:231-1121(-)